MSVNKTELFRFVTVSLVLLLCFIPQIAFAQNGTNDAQSTSIVLQYCDENAPLPDVEFSLYQVSDESYVNISDDFKDYPVRLECTNDDEWRALANTLAGYVNRDNITPLDYGKTNAQGMLQFPAKNQNMTTGLYLIIGETATVGEYLYIPEPFLVFLPSVTANGEVEYDITVSPKYERRKAYQTINISAVKIWEKDASTSRPEFVQVQLLKDGEIFDTQILNKDNNWKYIWENLNSECYWQMTEKDVYKDYTVSVHRNGNSIAVVNTYKPTQTTPTQPTDNTPTLPNTGMLLWPIPVLSAGGILIFSIGYIKRRKVEKSHE